MANNNMQKLPANNWNTDKNISSMFSDIKFEWILARIWAWWRNCFILCSKGKCHWGSCYSASSSWSPQGQLAGTVTALMATSGITGTMWQTTVTRSAGGGSVGMSVYSSISSVRDNSSHSECLFHLSWAGSINLLNMLKFKCNIWDG